MTIKPHDNIALFCTGSRCLEKKEPSNVQRYLAEQYQLNCFYAEETYLTLPAKDRAAIFLNYLFDDNINLLWALRGGEGTADIIPFLHAEHERIQQLAPKLIIGFSDITALLLYFSNVYSWPVVHGPGALQFYKRTVDIKSEKATFDYLFNDHLEIKLDSFIALNKPAENTKTITGSVTGGNLSLLNCSIKEIWEINSHKKIVLLEDINEKPHVIGRTLKHLTRIGSFAGATAMVLGDFSFSASRSDEPDFSKLMLDVLTSFAQECDFPVFKTNSIGHATQNIPLPFGKLINFNIAKKTISF